MTHTFYLGHDNDQALQLLEAGANLSSARYDAITRVTLTLRDAGSNTTILDSDVTAGLFDWSGEELVIEGSKLDDASVTAGSYNARLVIYSDDQPTGLVWLDFSEYVVRVVA